MADGFGSIYRFKQLSYEGNEIRARFSHRDGLEWPISLHLNELQIHELLTGEFNNIGKNSRKHLSQAFMQIRTMKKVKEIPLDAPSLEG